MNPRVRLLFVTGVLLAAPAFAEKTDVVEFTNGDRITGEIKSLNRGLLQFSTDHLGTIDVEWTKVARLSSNQVLEIELDSGRRLFGRVHPSDTSGQIVVTEAASPAGITIPVVATVRIATLDESGHVRERVDGYVNLGYSYTKATEVSQLNIGAGVSYRDRIRLWSLDASTVQSKTSASGSSESSMLHGEQRRFFGERLFWSGLLQFDRNDELGLDLRGLVGGSLGRYFIQSNVQQFVGFAGLGFAKERFADAGDVESTELILGTGYDVFVYDDPEVDLTVDLVVFPSLTVSGRVRAQAQLSLRYELIDDLYAEISFTDTFDSKPQSTGAEKNDYAVTTSLGYKF